MILKLWKETWAFSYWACRFMPRWWSELGLSHINCTLQPIMHKNLMTLPWFIAGSILYGKYILITSAAGCWVLWTVTINQSQAWLLSVLCLSPNDVQSSQAHEINILLSLHYLKYLLLKGQGCWYQQTSAVVVSAFISILSHSDLPFLQSTFHTKSRVHLITGFWTEDWI